MNCPKPRRSHSREDIRPTLHTLEDCVESVKPQMTVGENDSDEAPLPLAAFKMEKMKLVAQDMWRCGHEAEMDFMLSYLRSRLDDVRQPHGLLSMQEIGSWIWIYIWMLPVAISICVAYFNDGLTFTKWTLSADHLMVLVLV
ncbi:hypothetical protein AALO_G00302930 [Alosa alosa]|uniref:Uncharacterized protein n=1 Tax=Alosa alosa TaxID=278164 RepID=A0AAV6FEX9_9TELE|nr:hypothetical protein AALO_G00302930 [Alosa alosa]